MYSFNHLHQGDCDETCPRVFEPVCGDDGETYANECLLKLETCSSGKAIKKTSTGACDGKVIPIAVTATTAATASKKKTKN